jgi:hypothetical protein
MMPIALSIRTVASPMAWGIMLQAASHFGVKALGETADKWFDPTG